MWVTRLKQWTVPLGLVPVLIATGCGLLQLFDAARPESDKILLLKVWQLDPPAIGSGQNVFRPAEFFDVDSEASGKRATGFFVSVATARPNALRLRLVDSQTGTARDLVRIDGPAPDAERELAGRPRPFNDAVAATLGAGQGVSWLDQSAADGIDHRYAVLLPRDLLSAFTRLELFSATAADGTPILGTRLRLARDYFYLAIIGDSVQWGNGLPETRKMSALISARIERETGRKVICQRYAHTGAKIVPAEGDAVCEVNCFGEVPRAMTSIVAQADQIQRPDLLDLVLVGGCINDVGVTTILNPMTPETVLVELTEQFCDQEMGELLWKVRGLAPQARIVVTGYFQIVSADSDFNSLATWAETLGLTTTGEELEVLDAMVNLSVVFHDSSHIGLRAAVARVNEGGGGAPTIAFADPGFGPENAVFAPRKWLWSLTDENIVLQTLNLELPAIPEDPLQDIRLRECFDEDVVGGIIPCIYASVGHPNPAGAQAYADAIELSLRDLGVLPPVPAE